ncbi:MAG: DUF1579 domain-containing protein [Dehalococcoidia bacterium]|nr:DUF1579 domain-containing protein [Dehalococcoidia bacterium]
MQPEPTQEHRWLGQLVGDWTYESEGIGSEGAPMKGAGREHVRAVGEHWVLNEMSETVDGQDVLNLQMIGFDRRKGRFVGTFVSSMGTELWVYDGELDASGRKLTLSAEGPGMDGTGTALYHDIIEIVDANTRELRSEVETPEGEWVEFMTMRSVRAG